MEILKTKPSINLDTRPFNQQLEEAVAFFGDPSLTKELESSNPYADKDGLIEFICGVELLQDPLITAKLVELKSILISVTSVVTSYVNRYAAKNGPEYKTDPELWAKALTHVPLMGPAKLDTQTYSRKTKGVEIAADFVNLILNIAAGEGAALKSFGSFLEKQGNALKIGMEENKDYYKTATVGIAVEVFKLGDKIIYIPKIKLYRVDFTRENSKWNFMCASYEEVAIHFGYTYGSTVFDYEALTKPEVRKKFDTFITGQQQAQIEEATTFFNDDFETSKVKVAEKAASY